MLEKIVVAIDVTEAWAHTVLLTSYKVFYHLVVAVSFLDVYFIPL